MGHYTRLIKTGDLKEAVPIGGYDYETRFWMKVNKGPGCWEWTAGCINGYGHFQSRRVKGTKLAHRIAWRLTNGPIPQGLFVLHHCDNPPCVRPDHLWLGTQADNLADMTAKGRRRSRTLRGAESPRAVLNNTRAALLLDLHAEGWEQRDLAKRFAVSKGTVWNVIHGLHWTTRE